MRFYCKIFLFLWVSNISSQKFHTNYYVYLRGGPNLTKLKGYEKYLGNKFIKSKAAFGYETNIGVAARFRKLYISSSFGFRKSKSNFISLTQTYGDIASFDENFLRLDLLLYKLICNIEIGYKLSVKQSIFISLKQSLDTYHRGVIVNNRTLTSIDPNHVTYVTLYTNFDLYPNKPETLLGVLWVYHYSRKWNINFHVYRDVSPYELLYEGVNNPLTNNAWKLPIHETAIGLGLQYVLITH